MRFRMFDHISSYGTSLSLRPSVVAPLLPSRPDVRWVPRCLYHSVYQALEPAGTSYQVSIAAEDEVL